MAHPLIVRHAYALIRAWLRREGSTERPLDDEELQWATGGSRTEVREALAQLADDGIIRRRRRAGTLVDTRMTNLAIDMPIAYRPSTDDRYHHVELMKSSVPVSPAIAELFGGPLEEHYLVTDSLIQLDGQPLGLRSSFWRGSERPRPSPAGRKDTDMAQIFLETFGMALAECDARVDALSASDRFARQLGVAVGEPLLLREAVLRGVDGIVHEVNFTYYPSRRVSLRVTTPYGTPSEPIRPPG
jgi:GntR family transcriptional regulator